MAELSRAIARLMEERTQASTAMPQHRQLYDRIRERVAPGERAAAESLARLLLGRATPEFAEHASEDSLAALCANAYRFVAAAGDEPRVRVFQPEFERDGWDAPATVVETLISDRPFIVDTVRGALHRAGCSTRILLHPILGCERDAQRALTAITPPERSLKQESFIHAEVEPLPDAAAAAALEDDLRQRLRDLLLATNDYQAMRQATVVLANELRSSQARRPAEPPVEEIAAFLDWLAEGHMVFLGYRAYTLAGEGNEARIGVRPGSGLGLLRKDGSAFAQNPRVADLDPTIRRRILAGPPLIITKTTAESPVHRRARMDYIGVRTYDAAGRTTGERLLIGLFTARAYAEESAEVPLLRRKLQRILQTEHAIEDSHDHREISALFNSMPKEHLLAGTAEEIGGDIRAVRSAPGDDVRVTVRADQLERGMFVLVALPRESYSAELRRRVEAMVRRASNGTVLDQHVAMEEGENVRLHFYVAAAPEAVRNVRPDALRAEVRELLRTWDDRLRDALEADGTNSQPRALARQYAAVFSPEYKAATEVAEAVGDIRCIEALVATGQPQVELLDTERRAHSTLKLYLMNEEIVLSDFLPVLENLGLRVYGDDPIDVVLPAGGVVHVHAFAVLDATAGGDAARPGGGRLDLRGVGPRLSAAIIAHRSGRLADDALNSLILSAELTWQQVQVLRAYANHAVQSGVASRSVAIEALARHAASARALWSYLAAKFDPADTRLPRERMTHSLPPLEEAFIATLDAVASVAEDHLLRSLLATATATVRLNAFGRREDDPVAFKLDSGRVPHLAPPRPRYEIFVHGPWVEGVHLRAGKVARGGIRLSDRPDDYRTEVLALLKTQVVKNSVIVPTGAKGGFFVRRRTTALPGQTEIVAAYRVFIGALLSLTDNVVQGRVVPPAGVLYDEPDPYLVVAADKGTSSFSDVANDVAQRAGFWLADAFASGGSQGYDHKKIGITARGAWECVRRHFREMGRDVDTESISVIGIGDMSGDVFGNGLLQSPHVRLRAAFDHQYIFLDPEPDAAAAFAERTRLFGQSPSTWDDYDRAAISAGGGVFPRGAKKIALDEKVRAMLGVADAALSGEELVRAVLRMEADLLWNGGIGTYVRARAEADAEVGDSANDGVRVSARDLRVRVVAEGGNLGFTQAARVEFALRGGRINSDAIDNAGGVNLSDREVNLKILLGPLVESGDLGAGERNRLLADLAGAVTEQVLRTNREQSRVLSLDQSRSQNQLPHFHAAMAALEEDGVLDRILQKLPDKEVLRRRRGTYRGLTRPELAVLLAHAKLDLQQKLLLSSLPDDPHVERHLLSYFPAAVRERRAAIRNHRLRREIISVELSNSLIDVAGIAFVRRSARNTATDDVAVVRAWSIAASLSDLDKILADLADTAPPPAAEEAALFAVERAMERACTWILRTQDGGEPIGAALHRLLAPVYELAAGLPGLLPEERQQRHRAEVAGLIAAGVREDLAARIGAMQELASFLEVSLLSADLGTPLRLTAEIFYGAASVADLDWLGASLAAAAGEDRWERRAVDDLLESLVQVRRDLTRAILGGGPDGTRDSDAQAQLSQFVEEHGAEIESVRALVDDVKSAPTPSLAALFVLVREISRLSGREA